MQTADTADTADTRKVDSVSFQLRSDEQLGVPQINICVLPFQVHQVMPVLQETLLISTGERIKEAPI